MNNTVIARWEAKGGKRFIQLEKDHIGFCYHMDNGGGTLPISIISSDDAVRYMEEKHISFMKIDFPSTKLKFNLT